MPSQDEISRQDIDVMDEQDVFDIARVLVTDGMYVPIQTVAQYMEENDHLKRADGERFWGGLVYDLFQTIVPLAEEDGVVYNESPVIDEDKIRQEVKMLFQVASNSI